MENREFIDRVYVHTVYGERGDRVIRTERRLYSRLYIGLYRAPYHDMKQIESIICSCHRARDIVNLCIPDKYRD